MKGGAAFPVRLRYTKTGKIRWISHRDVARALERAFRVSRLPLAFSEGFSPRPKVSFGLALSTGHESLGEYLDVVLARPVDLDALGPLVTEALPTGMAVTGAAELDERAPALQEAITAVEWRVRVAHGDGAPVAASTLGELAAQALGAAELPAPRRRKGREVVEDLRPVIRRLDVPDAGDGSGDGVWHLELATQPRSAKPTDVLVAIDRATGVAGGLVEAAALRTHQWIERDGARWEPLDADTRPRVHEARAS